MGGSKRRARVTTSVHPRPHSPEYRGEGRKLTYVARIGSVLQCTESQKHGVSCDFWQTVFTTKRGRDSIAPATPDPGRSRSVSLPPRAEPRGAAPSRGRRSSVGAGRPFECATVHAGSPPASSDAASERRCLGAGRACGSTSSRPARQQQDGRASSTSAIRQDADENVRAGAAGVVVPDRSQEQARFQNAKWPVRRP